MTTATTFVPFTETRKKFIDHLRNRVITERPTRKVWTWGGIEHVTVDRPLSLRDYAVYAALRGADYRKGDHTGGSVATAELTHLAKMYKAYGAGKSVFLPSDHTVEELAEFITILETELARWKDAPVN